MEKQIKEIFNDLKDRITNPFTSSFIISWLINNYQIPITLFFYKQTELKADGFKSYLQLIKSLLSWEHMLIWPLCCALAYTFIFPWIKYFIHWYRAWVEVIDGNNLKRVQEKELIPLDVHNDLKSEYYAMVDKNSTIVQHNSNLQRDISEYKGKEEEYKHTSSVIRLLENDKQEAAALSKCDWFVGEWVVYNAINEDKLDIWKVSESRERFELYVNDTSFYLSDLIFDQVSRRFHFTGPQIKYLGIDSGGRNLMFTTNTSLNELISYGFVNTNLILRKRK